jgi:hypothetical protein
MRIARMTSVKSIGPALLALLAALPLIYAQGRGGRGESGSGGGALARGEPARMPEERSSAFVDRSNHGSIRHFDSNLAQPSFAAPRNTGAQQNVFVNRDVDADVNVPRYWSGFSHGARQHNLRAGSLRLLVNNVPYYYDDGIYYQQEGDDYEEVYPPVGADIPQPPDGAVEIDAGGLAYYYAGGAFYVEQDGGFVIAPTPIGVVVPELPPGSVQVAYNNGVAYQFNGVYYQPVFVDGVTQYMTVLPNPPANGRQRAQSPARRQGSSRNGA